jgi:hypothetical protein
MALDLTLLRLFVAQAQSSNIADFVGQISGLVALTCGAGLIWIALMAFIFQRGAERRRRAAQGLEPLPPIYTSLWQTLTGKRPARPASQPVVGPVVPPAPMPDLALLTGDVSLAEAAPAPAPIPSAQPEPETEMAPTPASQPGPPNSPADASAAPPEADEVLRVWRDRDTGALIVEIDGYRFLASEPPRGSDLERRFAALLRDLGAALPRADAPAPPAERPAARSGSPLRQIGRVALGQPVVEPPATGERSIAEQIEDLLQERLARLPEFNGRSIHVRPSLQGGVNIVVDNRQYEGIGDVDEPAVRALLEDVVREWEASQ